jgi:alkylation response protein AidB-like acyl-CoA dehydrogenase
MESFNESFLLNEFAEGSAYTPEDYKESGDAVSESVHRFIENNIEPNRELIEALNYGVIKELLRESSRCGLLSVEVPELYGGMGKDIITSLMITEHMAYAGSFAISHATHTGIGCLPIVYYGTEVQKRKYLKKLASGEMIASYCLTESEAGSDGLNVKTTARLSADGKSYVINGTKKYITNAALADVFIVFAKVDGTKFSAFLVEKEFGNITIGEEEQKMGNRGVSTCEVNFNNVPVPTENIIGDIGKGHVIAFNILNLGRLKLAAGCLGTSKKAMKLATDYARNRSQFGRPISDFPLVRSKISDMNVNGFILESMVYNTAGKLNEMLQHTNGKQLSRVIDSFSAECSINKVFGSEALAFAADEAVQIHGGLGFMTKSEVESIYRGARVHRIFEGTNEINRLLLAKRAVTGYLKEERTEPTNIDYQNRFSYMIVHIIKDLIDQYPDSFEEQQNVLSIIADLKINEHALGSIVHRMKRLSSVQDEGKEKKNVLGNLSIAKLIHGNVNLMWRMIPFAGANRQLINELKAFTQYSMELLLQHRHCEYRWI